MPKGRVSGGGRGMTIAANFLCAAMVLPRTVMDSAAHDPASSSLAESSCASI
jgi:hypothetical protein